MRHDLLPLSIFALAAAVALHAMAPAFAQDPQPVAPVVPATPAGAHPGLAPACKAIRLGTAKEFSTLMGELYEEGANQFVVVGSGLVCGWR
jgi:hypothetical protein